MNSQALQQLTLLKLTAMREEYKRQDELQTTHELTFDERFSMIVNEQFTEKYNNKIKRLIKNADLRDTAACFENLNFEDCRNLKKNSIAILTDCNWIRNGENLIITGSTGVGKTYLISAFGRQACVKGFQVKCYRITRLLTDLTIAKGDGSYNKKLKELLKPDLLILDDFGIKQMDVGMSQDFFEVIEDRHFNKKSLAIAAQLPVREWPSVFKDATIADAVMDRIIHTAYRFELKGPSRRSSNKLETSNDE